MRRISFSIAVVLTLGLAAAAVADPLAEITRKIDAKARRASSGLFDPESNADCYHIEPGQTVELTKLKGPGEIRHMWFTVAGRDRRWPRTLVLRICWDGAKTPSVETPIGDFFAAGNGMRANVNTLPIQTTSYGRALNCYWRMPFRKKAVITLTNEGKNRLSVYWQFDWMELPRAADDMFYFHARYRQEFPAKPFSPYVIFDGRGEGHYVGTVFSLQCSYANWFGESDDRFYVDGEAEPSIVGTGCEDFFNDAWNLREFTNPNTGVTIKEPNGEDCRFTAYRWHVRAPVTFRKSLKVDIERRSYLRVTNPETGKQEVYNFKYRPDFCSSVAFWYQKGIAERTEPFPSVDQRINKEIVLETAHMVPKIKTAPGTRAYQHKNRVCNLKQGLYVDNRKVDGWFEVPCRVHEEGIYSISVFQCLYKSGGIWKVTLKGPAGEIVLDPAMDFYDPYLAWKENRPENFLYGTWFEKKVGLHKLPSGDYVFRFESVGANPLSRQGDALSKPGLNCRLDGISLRRFPWDDLYGQLHKYLADEKALFAKRVEQAKRVVATLDRAIKRFHRGMGRYPRDLNELAAYLTSRQVPLDLDPTTRDAWGQHYRYKCPGRFNPDGFDVYSIHGNSRDAQVWIGNWDSPYRLPGAIEGESLKPTDKSQGVALARQRLRIRSAPPLSDEALLFVRFTKPGDFADFALPESIRPGKYRLRLRLVSAKDYGEVSVQLNGKTLARSVDTFSFVIGTKTLVLGPITIEPKKNVLRFEAVGRNPKSKGYRMGIDAVMLVPDE